MTHVNCRPTAKNRDQLRNSTLGNRVWATFTFFNIHTRTEFDEWAKNGLSQQTLLFSLPACLGISYSAAWHISFKPVPKIRDSALHCFCLRGAENPSHATISRSAFRPHRTHWVDAAYCCWCHTQRGLCWTALQTWLNRKWDLETLTFLFCKSFPLQPFLFLLQD